MTKQQKESIILVVFAISIYTLFKIYEKKALGNTPEEKVIPTEFEN